MDSSRAAHLAGYGVGAVGTAIHGAATTTLLPVVRYYGESAGRPSAETYAPGASTWIDAVGYALAYLGTPLLAALVAGYLAYAHGATLRNVAVGFGLGGATFGLIVKFVNWGTTEPGLRASAGVYALETVLLALTVFLPAVLGARVGARVAEDGDLASALTARSA